MSLSTTSQTGQRRRAYQCLKCLHRNDRIYIEARYRVFNHFLKEHLSLDSVPFYCKLCLFRAFKKEDLMKHVDSFPRHKLVLREKGLSESKDFLVSNMNPHQITERDVIALSSEESIRHWESIRKPDLMAQAVSTVFGTGLDSSFGSPARSMGPIQSPSLGLQIQLPSPATVQLPQPAPAQPVIQGSVQNPTVLDISQYVAPLQQLVNMLGASGSTGGNIPIVSTPPSGFTPMDSVFQSAAPGSIQQAPGSFVVPSEEVLGQPKHSSPVPQPSELTETDILNSLPSREECQALNKTSASPSVLSSSSSSSSGSDAFSSVSRSASEYHNILAALRTLQDSVVRLQESVAKQQQCTENMNRCMLNLAALLAKPTTSSSEQPTRAEAATEIIVQNTAEHHTQEESKSVQPGSRDVRADHSASQRYRERSPLRERERSSQGRPRHSSHHRDQGGKENRYRQRRDYRRGDRSDYRR